MTGNQWVPSSETRKGEAVGPFSLLYIQLVLLRASEFLGSGLQLCSGDEMDTLCRKSSEPSNRSDRYICISEVVHSYQLNESLVPYHG